MLQSRGSTTDCLCFVHADWLSIFMYFPSSCKYGCSKRTILETWITKRTNIKGISFSWVGGGQLVMRYIFSGYVWIFLQENCKLVVEKCTTNAVFWNTNPQAPVFFGDFKETTMKRNTDLLVPPIPSWRSHGMWTLWLQGGNKAWNSLAQARMEGKLLDD